MNAGPPCCLKGVAIIFIWLSTLPHLRACNEPEHVTISSINVIDVLSFKTSCVRGKTKGNGAT